jgi:hypothetical protein
MQGAMLVALLAGCGPTAQEKQVIDQLTSNVKSLCVGRFMMDVPQDMQVKGGITLYYGLDKSFKTVDVSIEALDSTADAMKEAVASEAEKLDKSDKNWETKRSMLLEYRVVDDHAIYLRKLRALESGDGSKHELHILVGGTRLLLAAESYEGIADAGYYEPGGKVETPEPVAARLFRIARQIRAYDVPGKAGPGYCLGPVVIDSDQDEERGSVYLRMGKYPDLLITIYSQGLVPDQPDQQLAKRMSVLESYSSVDVLRNVSTTLGGMKAHEWLGKMTDDHDVKVLLFAVESMRPNPALDRPYLNITLDAGGQRSSNRDDRKYVDSSLTPKEGVALWDTMIRSFRLRPDAVNHNASENGRQP